MDIKGTAKTTTAAQQPPPLPQPAAPQSLPQSQHPPPLLTPQPPSTCRRGHVKMDPAKKAKSVILNPHLWSLKRLQQRPRGRPRKNPVPEKFRKSLTSGKHSV